MRKKAKAKVRRVYRRAKKRATTSAQTGFLSKYGKPLGAIGYGMMRQKVSNFVANSSIGKQLPVSQFTDEGVMLGLMWGAKKLKISKGIVGSVVRTGESVEYARVGQTITDLYFNKVATATNNGAFTGGGN